MLFDSLYCIDPQTLLPLVGCRQLALSGHPEKIPWDEFQVTKAELAHGDDRPRGVEWKAELVRRNQELEVGTLNRLPARLSRLLSSKR